MAEPWENVVARRVRHVAQTLVCITAVVTSVVQNGPLGLFLVLATPVIWLLSWPMIMLVIEVPASVLLASIRERREADWLAYEKKAPAGAQVARLQQPYPVQTPRFTDDRYGTAHQNLRAAWKDIIRLHGADCMERECLMPSRRIEAGASWDSWDLAHDHEKGGQHDYLGPAHKVCNQAEALSRGVTWEGAPTLAELISKAGTADRWGERVKAATDPWAAPADAKRLKAVERPDPGSTAWRDGEPPF